MLWIGPVLVIAGAASYPLFFARFPITRDVPWASLLIMALGLALLGVGIARAFRQADAYRGKISGSILGVLALAFTALSCYGVFVYAKQIPASYGAPQVGQLAPDFTLPDSKNKPVNLSGLVSSPFAPDGAIGPVVGERTAATLLIFYRGYW